MFMFIHVGHISFWTRPIGLSVRARENYLELLVLHKDCFRPHIDVASGEARTAFLLPSLQTQDHFSLALNSDPYALYAPVAHGRDTRKKQA